MGLLEFEWEDGEVGDYWLRIGLNDKCVHVYQTPWSGPNWWIDGEMFGLVKQTYYSLDDALDTAEIAVEKWIAKAVYRSPAPSTNDDYDDDAILL